MGDGMYLRELQLKDAPLMLAWMHDVRVTGNLRGDFGSKTIDDAKQFISASTTNKDSIDLAIASDEDEYMGTVSLKHIENHAAEFAIAIRYEAMGYGYAWFGMKTIIEKAFADLDIYKVYWCVSSNNLRAVRFYDKHGFQETQDIAKPVLERYRTMDNLKWYSISNEEYWNLID